MKKTINAEIVKARIDELQADIDRVKKDLLSLKESAQGDFRSEDVQKLDEYTRELLTYKAGQSELLFLLQD